MFDVTLIPREVWIFGIFSKLHPQQVLTVPLISRYFRDAMEANEDAMFDMLWKQYSTRQIPISFRKYRWNILNSLVYGSCLRCGSTCMIMEDSIPAWICIACLTLKKIHPLSFFTKTEICKLLHLKPKQFEELHLEDIRNYYWLRNVAMKVYRFFGSRDEWLKHWKSAERRKRLQNRLDENKVLSILPDETDWQKYIEK